MIWIIIQKLLKEIGEAMEERSVVKTSYIGNGRYRNFSAREAITLATAYFHIHRDQSNIATACSR